MTAEKYNRGARAFHWTIAILVITNIALGLLHEPLEKTINLIPLHKSFGLTVLVLTLGRIGWHLTWTKPPLPASLPQWERTTASVTHFLFYALTLAMPLTGWVFSSAGKFPLTFFGLFDWPKLPVTKEDPIVGVSHEGHEVLGWVMLALGMLHVAAALRHHFLLKDNVLRRML